MYIINGLQWRDTRVDYESDPSVNLRVHIHVIFCSDGMILDQI